MKTILAIDDQKDNLTTIEAVIKTNLPNCKVLTALSGKEGIEIARKEQPDTILLDIIMPEMDGYEVCAKLKEDELTKHIPVIMLTAIKTDAKSRVKGLNIGADAFLAKPIDAVELSAQVNVMLRIKDAEDKLRAEKKDLEKVVTERTKVLRKSEDFLKTIYDYSEVAIFVVQINDEGDYYYESVNRTHEKLFGVKSEEYIGKTLGDFEDIFGKENIDNLNTIYDDCFRNKTSHSSEFEIQVNGNKEWWVSRIIPLSDEKGNIYRLIGNAVNITSLKEYEEQLSNAAKEWQMTFDSSKDVIWILDKENNILQSNQAAEEFFKKSRNEIIGKKCWEIVHLTKSPINGCPFICSKQSLKRESMDLQIGELWFKITVDPILDSQGKYDGSVHMMSDITERKQAEEEIKKMAQMLDIAPNSITVHDFKGNFLFANQKTFDIHGYTRDEFLSLPLGKIDTPETAKMIPERMKKVIEKGEYQFEVEHYRKDGSIIPLEVQAMITKWGDTDAIISIATDISERKRATEAIKDSEEKFRTLATSSPVGIYLTDKDGNCTYANPFWLKMAGMELDEALGLNWINAIHPEDRETINEKWYKSVESDGKWVYEYRFLDKNAKTTWVSGTASKLKDSQGNIIGYVGSNTDITTRKQSEEILLKMRMAINNANEVIFMTDKEGIINFVNPQFTKMYGYTADEVVGKVTPRILKSEFFKREENEQLWNALLSKHSIPAMQYVNKQKNGNLIEIEGSADPILDDKGDIIGFLGIHRDNTNRKRTEQIQKVLYNISNAILATKNLEDLISLIQKELGSIIDTTNFYIALYDEESDYLSLPFVVDEMENPTHIPAGKTLTKYVIKTQKPLLANKEKILSLEKSGHIERFGADSEVWLGVPLKIDGIVIGVLAVQSYSDENAYNESDMEILEFVSEQVSISIQRKKAEDDLLVALEKATESDRLKSAFLTNMSHEIRTPMNGILGFTNLLKEPELSGEEQQEYISIIEKSGDRMLNTISDLMDISMIESGQMKTTISNINIYEQTKDLYSFFKPEAENKGMKIFLNNSFHDSEIVIKTDKEKLNSILTNLIKNAIKYSNVGNIEFGYNLVSGIEAVEAEFYVKDQGIGIPKDRQEAIFDRFVQADIEDKDVYEGSGLGLSIAKAYVEMLGGKIWIESEEGIGSTFYFTIPNISDNKEIAEIKKPKSKDKSEHKDKMLKILIAEDEEYADLYLTKLLQTYCSTIFHAKTGFETVEIFRKNPDINLILMDIKMPRMGGHEATRLIRELNKDVPIIAQTAYALEGDREKALEVGCDDYISKPIDKDELLEKIERLIKSH
ncbi:PAS domain S-box protein [Bacteroidota bacterium]